MKKLNSHQQASIFNKPIILFVLTLLLILFFSNGIKAQTQQLIGVFTSMDGGFEGQTATTTVGGTAANSLAWTVSSTSAGTRSISNNSSMARTGNKYATFNNTNSSTTRRLQTPTMSAGFAATKYTVQFYYRTAGSTAPTNLYGGCYPDGTTGVNQTITPVVTGTNGSWIKATATITTTVVSTSSGFACVRHNNTGASNENEDIDDFVMYAGDVDTSIPDAPTAPTTSNPSNTSITVSWTAPGTGVDNGGYMVVRGTTDPTTTPNANGIYAVGNTVATGETVVYIGTNNTFTDISLTEGTKYYYRIYTVDKAFNYSSALTTNATASSTSPNLSLSSLTGFGGQILNTTTVANSFIITGTNLTNADITVGTLGGYTYSTTSNGTYTSSLSISQPGGSFSQTIYVKFTPTAAQSYNGNIAVAGGGATSVNCAVTGSGLSTEPSTQASSVTFSGLISTGSSTSGVTINWSAGDGTNHIVLVKASNTVDSNPSDGVSYTGNLSFGSGSQIGTGNYVVFTGAGTSAAITGLTKGTTYFVKVYTFNGSGTTENYLTSSSASGSQMALGTITSNGSSPSSSSKSYSDGTAWVGGVAPGQNDIVKITSNDYLNVGSTQKCYNLTIDTGSKLYSNTAQTLQIYGTSLVCNGVFGDPSIILPASGGTGSALTIEFGNNLNIGGSGSIYPYKVRPVTALSNIGVTFGSNTTITYNVAGTLSDNTGNDNISFTVNTGIILNIAGNMNTVSSANSNGNASTTWNINGTINVTGAFSPLVNLGKSYTCNINNGGSLSVLNLSPTIISGGASPTINIANGGQFTVTGLCDLTGGSAIVFQGAGTFATASGATVKIANTSGLDFSTGPIRTSSTNINFNVGTNFNFSASSTSQNSTTTNGSPSVTLSSANGNIVVGMGVSGTGISAGTTVSAVSGTSVTLSQNATATGSAVSLSYYVISIPAQTTGNNFPSTINALTINNANGVTLSGSTTVNGTLTMSSGTLYVGANNLTLKGTRSGTGNIDGASGTITYAGTSQQTASNLVNVNNLVINNTASSGPGVTLLSATTVGGTLYLTAGAIFNGSPNPNINLANGAKIECAGGTFSSGPPVFGSSVNLTYTGSAAKTTGYELPTNASVLNNLTISNSGGVTLAASATVNGTLTLTSGLLSTGTNTLTIGTAGSISGASSSNYVNGNLALIYGSTGSKTFPVGKGGNYRPVTINATALDFTPSTFTVNQTESAFSGTLISSITSTLARSWSVAQTGSTVYMYDLSLDGTGFLPSGLVKILQNNGGNVTTYSTTGSYTASGIASVGSFGLGDFVAVVPQAPTIGTANAGDAQASVTFTGSNDDGGSAVIDYTVTSNPGNLTATGASSPLTVTGLTNGTAYTFNVTARNSIGSSLASSASNSVTPAPATVSVSANANLSTYFPSSATDVTVTAGELTIDGNSSVKSLTAYPGAKITLASGKSLTVVGVLRLQSDATGTATLVDNGGTITAGSTNVQQYLTSGRNWYISSPISNGTTVIFSPAGGSNILYWYDEANGSTKPWPYSTRNDSTLEVMRGYVANMSASGAVTFSGSLNTGAQQISLTRHAGQIKEGFNLIGNPYPSYLNFESAMASTSTSNISQTLWFRLKNAGNTAYVFDTYNALSHVGTSNNNNSLIGVTANIPPMQAFWVRVADGQNSGVFAVDNSMRSHQDQSIANNRFKAPAINEAVLHLQVSNGINTDEAIVLFNPNASNTYDAYDSEKMTNANALIPEIYTVMGNEQLVINGMNSIQYDTEIPMGFSTGQSSTFTIKASQFSNFDSGTQIILRDKALNIDQDLTAADYSFTSEATNTDSRFALIFRAPSVATGFNSAGKDNVWISTNTNNQLVINGMGTVSVFNAVGQKLTGKNLTASTSVIETPLQSGVYFVTVSNAGKSVTQKVIIK